MKRIHDWPERLAAHIAAARDARFEWGKFDCAMFASDAIRAMTGFDLAADFRGQYSDEAGARAKLPRALTYANSVLSPIALGFARRGDLLITANGSADPGFAIIGLDGRSALCACDRGLLHVARPRWIKAWRV